MHRSPRLRLIIIVYWFLLSYIVAALVWWFIALQRQNNKMTTLLLNELKSDTAEYDIKILQIQNDNKRKTAQYIGEGAIFLALILIGAVFVYRATRRQLRLSIQQQNFMMAVTHELKTPIAVVQLNIETMQKRRLDESQQQKLIGVTLQEVTRLNSLCNNILLASQLDGGQYRAEQSRVSMSGLAAKAVNDFAIRYANRKIKGNIATDIYLAGEALLLEMLISNLIENAVKYSAKEKEITVQLSENDNSVILQVADGGDGIAAGEKEKIFEKFYRVGNEQTRTAKGTGLGLYLCRQIALQHKAVITVSDNTGGGAVFTVIFKKINYDKA